MLHERSQMDFVKLQLTKWVNQLKSAFRALAIEENTEKVIRSRWKVKNQYGS